jgi:Kef-type K+ transport system membrane component KefB
MSKPVAATTPKKNWKGTFILFLSIVIGIFLFMLVAIMIGQSKGALMPALNKNYRLMVIITAVVSIVCLYFARTLFTRDTEAAKNSLKPVNEKLNDHRQSLIKYLLICEMPVMLSIVLYLLTANFVFQVYAGVFLGFMLTMTPTKKKVAEQLGLNSMETQELY